MKKKSFLEEQGFSMIAFVALRSLFIVVLGIWLFQFHLDYKLPRENNLLLFFVAIPIFWATLTQLWTSYGYRDVNSSWLLWASHLLSMLLLAGTVFLVSVVLNTVADILDATGTVLFHAVGWTVLLGMVLYDLVDASR